VVAVFLNIWYRQRCTAAAIADVLAISRSHIAHSTQKQAVELVARRFLELAWRVEVPRKGLREHCRPARRGLAHMADLLTW